MGFLPRARSLVFVGMAATIIAGAPTLATAQSRDQQWAYCTNENDAYAFDLAIDSCTAIIQSRQETTQNLAGAFNNRGDAYQKGLHDYVRAIADYTQSIALYPQLAVPFSNRGNAYLGGAQPDYARAIADFDHAAQLDPTNAEYQDGRCWARALANRDLDVARAACDASLGLRPNNAGVLDSRGLVGLKQQHWQDAWNDYNAAATLNGTHASYFYGRGIAALRLGHGAEGRADLAHAAQLDPNIAQMYAGYGATP